MELAQKKFMQVGVMSNACTTILVGRASGFRDIATFKFGQFPFGSWTINSPW